MASASILSILPRPERIARGGEGFQLNAQARLAVESGDAETVRRLGDALRTICRLPLPPADGGSAEIRIRIDPRLADALGDEGYRLAVTGEGVRMQAGAAAGAFYGCQTLRQLLPPGADGTAMDGGVEWTLPGVEIEDRPRFKWRGLMLDCSRYFFPVAFIKRFIDLMAMHRLNTFHWHLTDDPGWRLEIRKYPRLTEIGAWRRETLVGHLDKKPHVFDGKRYGGYYTQAEVREIIAYAADRFVNVVPEIEMPGHSCAAIAAYPELGCVDVPLEPARKWGFYAEHTVNADDSTVRFFQDVLDETLELFPSRFIHIGGDEAHKGCWKGNPRIEARIRELGLKDEDELQAWFIRQMDQHLAGQGRRLVGWDEICEGGLAPGATVMSWRGTEGALTAARSGHDTVIADTRFTYFDYYQGPPENEPLAIGGLLPLEKVYEFDPIPPGLTPAQAAHVLGGQGQVWTEYIPDADYAEYMTYPRACALAEVLWSSPAGRDFAEFRPRLEAHLERLKALGVNYRPLDAAQR